MKKIIVPLFVSLFAFLVLIPTENGAYAAKKRCEFSRTYIDHNNRLCDSTNGTTLKSCSKCSKGYGCWGAWPNAKCKKI